jgi:hypothetical protein
MVGIAHTGVRREILERALDVGMAILGPVVSAPLLRADGKWRSRDTEIFYNEPNIVSRLFSRKLRNYRKLRVEPSDPRTVPPVAPFSPCTTAISGSSAGPKACPTVVPSPVLSARASPALSAGPSAAAFPAARR